MQNLIGLSTLLVFCLGITAPVWAQREVKPPAVTPLDAKPAISQPVQASTLPIAKEPVTTPKPEQTAKKPPEKANKDTKPAPIQAATVPSATAPKQAAKPAQSAKTQPQKADKNTKPAPVQASMVPAATEAKKAAKTAQSAKTQPEKAKKTAKPVADNEGAAKPKAKKIPKICKTHAGQEPGKVAQAKKASTKVADKPAQKRVLRATTVPVD
jgi:hypothetical protein